MNTAPSPADVPNSNVEAFPPQPRLRIVEKLAAAEADVVKMSDRVSAAIADAQADKKKRKPRAKKPDPLLQQASKASDTQANAQDATGASPLETDPVADAQASAAGPALLLDTVVATALPPSGGDVSLREVLGRAFAWLVFGLIAVTLLLAGAMSAARASGNNNGPTCVGNNACPTSSGNTTNAPVATGGQGGDAAAVAIAGSSSSSKSGAVAVGVNDNRSSAASNQSQGQDQGQAQSLTYVNERAPVSTAQAPAVMGECQSKIGLGGQGVDGAGALGIPISKNHCRIIAYGNWLLVNVGKSAAIRFMCAESDAMAEAIGTAACTAKD